MLPAPPSPALSELLDSDTECVVWWATVVECQSALLRHHREGRVRSSLLERAMRRLGELIDDADVMAPTSPLRDRAGRLLAAHPLRAADALQLAAALAWCEDVPRDEAFVSLDNRLRQAAAREGFTVLPT